MARLRERNERRCERILDVAARSPLHLEDLPWASIGDHELEPAAVEVLVYMRDVEGFTDRDLVGLTAHRTTLGDPVIGRFLPIWRAEEAGHAAALELVLDRYAGASGVAVAPRPAPPPAEVPLVERVVARVGGPVGTVVAAAHMAWGAANELLTLNGYRLLAARCGHPLVAEVARRIAEQEARHFSFYLLQAEWRLASSRLARRVLRAVLDGAWTPVGVGDGYKAPEEFAAVLRYLAAGPEGERAVARMDRRFAALPGFDELRIYERAAALAA